MLKIPRLRLMSFFLAAIGLLGAGTVYAVLIPADALQAGVGIGNGLNGAYYNAPGSFAGISDAATFVKNNAPAATFTATTVDYPNGALNTVADSTTLSDYLGADASSLSAAGGIDLNTSIFKFSGYISILEEFDQNTASGPIDVAFTVGSDDGFLLRIGEVLVTSFSGPRAFGTSQGAAAFAGAGLYSLELIYYENHGGTGIEFAGTIAGGGIVPEKYLFKNIESVPVPEPSAMLLLGIGLFAIGTAYRQKAKMH